MVSEPAISVALCTYNGAAWIKDQLQSLVRQTLVPDEIIVCDDGSTDNTLDLVENFSAQYPGIFKVSRNQSKLGPRKNFEQAISFCRGAFIFLCDQDDVWLPSKIEKSIYALNEHPSAKGVFCNGMLMDEKGVSLQETMWDALYWEEPLRKITNPENLLRYLLTNGNIVTGTALCIRRSACEDILPFQTVNGTWHDHWIALVLAACRSLIWLPEPLLLYRIHAQQQVGFSGRGLADPQYRQAVFDSWLYPNTIGQWQTTHLVWALQRFEMYAPLLKNAVPHARGHVVGTGNDMKSRFYRARERWLKTIPWPARKWKLLKHWLHGGEYLRIRCKELFSI